MADIYPNRELSSTLFPYQPQAALSFNRGLSQDVAGSVPSPDITQQISTLLRQYQSGLQGQGFAAQQEQAKRLGAPISQELIGASPSVQEGVRSADVSAIQPTIGGIRSALTETQDVLGLIKDIETQQERLKNDAYKRVHDKFTLLGGQAYQDATPEQKTSLEKAAGLDRGYIDSFGKTMTLREKQLELQQKRLSGIAASSPAVDAAANALLEGRIAPSQLPGFGQNSLRAQVLRRAYELKPDFDASKAEQRFAFGKAEKTQLLQFSIKSVTSAQKIIKDLSNRVKRTDIQPINALELSFRSKTGDVNTAKFLGAVKILGDEYGAVFGQGAATDFKAQLGLAVVDPTLSNQQFNALIDTTVDLLRARSNAIQEQAGQPTIFQTNQPDTRVIKGKTYLKKSDGLWYPQ